MATNITVQEVLAKMDMLDYQLRTTLHDLNKLRERIAECLNPQETAPSPAPNATLKDVYNNLKKHKASRSNLRMFCKAKGINTLEVFLKNTPKDFMSFKGIGPKTLYDVRKAIESLGIVWSDVR